jgi:uracil-DNA glycosylase
MGLAEVRAEAARCRAFVGPAGALLDAGLDAAGIDRKQVYVTNIVKHFKWERGAKSARRIHKKPNATEIAACRPWFDAEVKWVKPRLIVCLGATAAQAILGKSFRVTKQRGVPVESPLAEHVVATVHPSSS